MIRQPPRSTRFPYTTLCRSFAAALTDWGASGIPALPGAWLTTAARRRALNVLRHRGVERRYLPLLVEEDTVPGPGEEPDDGTDRKSTRLNSSHANISYAVFC